MMSLNEFLVWLTSGGSIVAVSWLLEKWAWFQNQSRDLKQYISYGFSAALALGAYFFNTYASADLIAQLSPIFTILATTFVSIFVGQVYHFFAKEFSPE